MTELRTVVVLYALAIAGVFIGVVACQPLAIASETCPNGATSLEDALETIHSPERVEAFGEPFVDVRGTPDISVVHVIYEGQPSAMGFVFIDGCAMWSASNIDPAHMAEILTGKTLATIFAKTEI